MALSILRSPLHRRDGSRARRPTGTTTPGRSGRRLAGWRPSGISDDPPTREDRRAGTTSSQSTWPYHPLQGSASRLHVEGWCSAPRSARVAGWIVGGAVAEVAYAVAVDRRVVLGTSECWR